MAELKTKPNDISVPAFIAAITDDSRRTDCETLLNLMAELTGEPPVMWGDSIVGFGSYHYRYASGREGDWMRIGFSPRKRDITIYLLPEIPRESGLLEKLGKHKTAVSCLYIKKLADIDLDVLTELIKLSLDKLKELYG